jgi:hypothetical protein
LCIRLFFHISVDEDPDAGLAHAGFCFVHQRMSLEHLNDFTVSETRLSFISERDD